MPITCQEFVEEFVKIHYDDLIDDMTSNKQTLTDKIIQRESFRTWFNEDWVADRWINYVSNQMNNMNDKEKTDLLVDFGLDNAFDMMRLIGIEPENYSVDKLTWYILDHWYSYDYMMRKFKEYK